jgi:large subunit ribosomal protein L6
MIQGANEGFSKTLIAEGIGYKFKIDKETLILNIGLSHSIKLSIPTTLTINLDSTTRLTLIGTEKENVTFFAAKIRAMKQPEPYKGKGILYEGEKILRKVGKTGR